MDTEERLQHLETTVAFQDSTINELSDALVRQQARLDELEGRVRLLIEMSETPGSLVRDVGDEEPPPHY